MKVIINNLAVELADLDIPFSLNSEQVSALEVLAEFMESDEEVITLSGSAGTGKTTIVRVLLHYLWLASFDGEIVLTAPTHKARLVLSKLAACDTSTIHALLGLRPNLSVLELDMKELDFLSNDKEAGMPHGGLLLVDEASMVTDALHDMLVDKASCNGTKIIFIGDIAQLQPVRQGELSKVFGGTNVVTLTKVERQVGGNPLLDTLVNLRDRAQWSFESAVNNDKGLIVNEDIKEFLASCRDKFVESFTSGDIQQTKVLCYTNARVGAYNGTIRKLLKLTSEYVVGEFLTGYDNYSPNVPKGSLAINMKRNVYPTNVINSMDYVVLSVESTQKALPYITNMVKGYNINMLDVANNSKTSIFIISKNNNPAKFFDDLAETIEYYRSSALTANWKDRKTYWKTYYTIIESFATPIDLVYSGRVVKKKTIDYGYAISTHKSQGSTYDNVFVDMNDILKCRDLAELRQLQYVALSRPRNIANILIKS